jgi:hypothetical protein
MRLYFNGCSHTYGDDLADQTQAWPALIAKKLSCEFVNDAVSGGTNDRILYRTIKHAQEFDRIYIAWTYTTRFTRYRSDNNHEVNFNPQLKHTLYGNAPEFKEYGKWYYQAWHNELYSFKLWLQDIVLLQRYLESINKPYVMINADNNCLDRWNVDWPSFNSSVKSLLCFDLMHDDQLLQEHAEIQSLLSQINTDNYVGWNQWWLATACKIHPVGPTGHSLADGHQYIADYIQKHDSYSRPHC